MQNQKEQNKNFESEQSAIARLNDDLRCRGGGGRVLLTQGVLAQGQDFAERALVAVRQFDAFDERNDPYKGTVRGKSALLDRAGRVGRCYVERSHFPILQNLT